VNAIILAAGVARRLAPITDKTHKALLPVGGRPLLLRMLGALADCGIRESIIVVGHCGDQVRATAGTRLGRMAIRYVENPEYMGIHYMDATSVEECWRLLRQTGKSSSYESLANIPRYSEWLRRQDWTDAYARHRQNLQLIGLDDPEKRWVLKNPSHMTALDALLTVYPDALVVYTHRDPVVCIASSCSLSAETTAGHSRTFVGDVIGRTQLDLWSRAFHAFHDARPAYDAAQFADVAFSDLRADPVGVVRGLYEQWGLDLTPEALAAVEEIDRESKEGAAKPSHSYSLADYGLTERDVKAAFDR
jgi:hypothetical protein